MSLKDMGKMISLIGKIDPGNLAALNEKVDLEQLLNVVSEMDAATVQGLILKSNATRSKACWASSALFPGPRAGYNARQLVQDAKSTRRNLNACMQHRGSTGTHPSRLAESGGQACYELGRLVPVRTSTCEQQGPTLRVWARCQFVLAWRILRNLWTSLTGARTSGA